MTNPPKRRLIAADSNFVIDLAAPKEFALDALEIIKKRLTPTRFIVSPTTIEELVLMANGADSVEERALAQRALSEMRSHGLDPINLVPVGHGIADQIALRFSDAGLLPLAERNDGLILAEASLLGCSILLTSDKHLRGLDFQRASLELQAFDLSLPIIATPREIIGKFG